MVVRKAGVTKGHNSPDRVITAITVRDPDKKKTLLKVWLEFDKLQALISMALLGGDTLANCQQKICPGNNQSMAAIYGPFLTTSPLS